MAKTKKVPEKQPEVLELRRTTRNRTKTSRPSLVLPSLEKSKDKVKNAASSNASTKTKAKNKAKNEPSTSSRTSKKQTKPTTSTPKTVSVGGTSNKSANKRSSHGDLHIHTRPASVNLQRIFTNTGELPNNYLTSIIQKDWQKHMTEVNQAKSNTSLKGIQFFPYQAMRWKYKNGVTYAMYDTKKEDKLSVGVLIIGPGRKKKASLTGQYIKYTVLCGKANLIADGIREHYDSGCIFTIPPNVKYAIKNVSDAPCYLNFFSYGENQSQ